jgi:ribosomal protein S18 acetylase RimI-like enzyme
MREGVIFAMRAGCYHEGRAPRRAPWITTAQECELWAGGRVAFPIDWDALPSAVEFAPANAFSRVESSAFVAFGQRISKTQGRGHLARLIVNPMRRGRGYGAALVRALLEQARRASFERVSLNVSASNAPAVSLYVKLGFADAVRPPDEPQTAGTRYMEIPV